jgi:CheY-like chemotaxis protein
LSIVERVGKVLGHPIGLRSAPGSGSIFSVDLPRSNPTAGVETDVTLTPFAGRMVGVTALCLDNEPSVLEGMQTLLSEWGCTVVTARNLAEAVDQLRAGAPQPDIILADYHLDEGTGIEAVAAVRAVAESSIPAIVITADHSAEVQREIRTHGHTLLRKPLKVAALRALMFQLTMKRAVAAE